MLEDFQRLPALSTATGCILVAKPSTEFSCQTHGFVLFEGALVHIGLKGSQGESDLVRGPPSFDTCPPTVKLAGSLIWAWMLGYACHSFWAACSWDVRVKTTCASPSDWLVCASIQPQTAAFRSFRMNLVQAKGSMQTAKSHLHDEEPRS